MLAEIKKSSVYCSWAIRVNHAAEHFCHFAILRRLERVFHCCSVCETMDDYKKGYLMVWANYVSLQLYCWAIL